MRWNLFDSLHSEANYFKVLISPMPVEVIEMQPEVPRIIKLVMRWMARAVPAPHWMVPHVLPNAVAVHLAQVPLEIRSMIELLFADAADVGSWITHSLKLCIFKS